MSRRFLANSCVVAAFVANAFCFASNGVAQEFDEQFAHWPVDLKISGRIVVDNGTGEVEERERFLESLGSGNSIAFLSRSVNAGSNDK